MNPDLGPPDEGDPRQWARAIGPETFDELKTLAFQSKSEPTKLAALREILDRGYGRSPLAAQPDDGEAPQMVIIRRESLWQTDPGKAIPDPSRR